MRIIDWSSDVCSSDLGNRLRAKSLIRHQCAAKIWRIDATGAISTPGYAVQEDIPAQLIIEAHCPGELFERCFRIGVAGDILAPVEALGRRGIKRQVHAEGRNLENGRAHV